ncbi:M23 family metallopeptidase [Candidatus Arthromitus sp. SFB-turkey]|uniref:M23 family metallopeptidase n=1 Tax=Candidatus Arthromitus sp. SFB-turkey TaxID=1840217 RepID=UPI0007F508A6|nr:M23 family metallopeptidase [Candidatus Arthromitus sp. SFB-turkey]OAT89037.1 peptidase [Candidatus Arthromitus sp. SFB-turkey]
MYRFKHKMSISVILMIINFVSIILIISYLSGKTLGYEMIINDEFSTYVKDKKILNEYYFEKLHNTSSESRKFVKSDSINFNLKLIDKDEYLETNEAIEFLDKNINLYVEGYNLILDGKKIANIDGKEVFDNVKERLIKYYLKEHNLENSQINWTKIKEDVKLEKDVINLKSLLSEDELYDFIISNNKNNNTIATVEIVARKTYLENNLGNKIQVVSLSSQSNQKEQYNKKNFDREVVNEITYNNDKYIGMRRVSSKTLKPSLSEVQGNELFYLNNPSKNNVITSPFGLRWGGEKHHGIDIAGNIGDPIFAAESGFASLVSYNSIYGNYMKLNHGKGVETLYGHCDVMFIKEGEYVTKGQIIGKIGNTGRSTGPHLHFEVRVNGKADNPLNYVAY